MQLDTPFVLPSAGGAGAGIAAEHRHGCGAAEPGGGSRVSAGMLCGPPMLAVECDQWHI